MQPVIINKVLNFYDFDRLYVGMARVDKNVKFTRYNG